MIKHNRIARTMLSKSSRNLFPLAITESRRYFQTFDSDIRTFFSRENEQKKKTKEYLADRREYPRGRSFCFRDIYTGAAALSTMSEGEEERNEEEKERESEREGGREGGRGRWLSGARQNGAKLCRSREAYLGRSRLYAETWWHRYRRLNVRR